MSRFVLALFLVAVLAACGTDDDDDAGTAGGTVPIVSETDDQSTSGPQSTPPPSTTQPPTTTPPSFSVQPSSPLSTSPRSTMPGTPVDPSLPVVRAAVDDLAGRLGIESDAVTVVDARAVTWPDGSLGCPQPGMLYTQVLVDGMLVILEAGGQRYEYHGGDPLFLCEHPK
jgi:hypothetical protein